MRQKASFSWLYIPISILIFLAFALFIERSGISYTVSHKPVEFLPPVSAAEAQMGSTFNSRETRCLILSYTDSVVQDKAYETVAAALDSMKVPYHQKNIGQTGALDIAAYDTIIISFVEFSRLSDYTDHLLEWINNGGKLMFAIRPDNSQVLREHLSEFGIAFLDPGYIESDGIEFLTAMLPGSSGQKFGLDFMIHSSLPVNLASTTILHAISADDQGVPLIWEKEYGDGKIMFVNSDQFIDKSSRGVLGAAYSALQDVVIYPVINAATFHIDDFPAPIPEGTDEKIFSQFTRDIQSFYLNVWWPDMQELQEKYNLVYSAFIIETYNYQTEPPFVYDINQQDIFQYFGGLVLRDGGEVGLHGYNHIPLCVEEDKKNQVLGYPTWPSQISMQKAVDELHQFSTGMLSGQPFTSYVPVSNMLCDQARRWLPEIVPELHVIASVYLPDVDVPAYVQEFEEADDGIIEYPRITSGYHPSDFMRWAQVNELWLHYAAGHFVHPDDVLDSYRSQGNTWLVLRETLDEYLLWLYSAMPNARNLTASEGGMAVQRYARLVPHFDCEVNICQVTLDGFYDEGWLMMRTNKTPADISSGSYVEVTNNLYLIEADEAKFEIRSKVGQ